MRSLVRFVKHLLLAVGLIASGICMLEVGLRAHRLHEFVNGGTPSQDTSFVRPCPSTYQHLPVHYTGTYWSEASAREVAIRTNSLGLRDDEVVLPKPVGTYRIVCLGDEATLAPDVESESTFCSQLEELLRPDFESPVEIINAGQPGHCPLVNLAWSRARLIGLQPDLVILCCDVSDVADDRRCRPLANFDAGGRLVSVGHPAATDRPSDLLSAVEQEFLLASLLSDYLGDHLGTSAMPLGLPGDAIAGRATASDLPADHSPVSVEQTWEPLRELQDLCRQISAEFVVVVVPSSATVRSNDVMESDGAGDRVGEIIKALVDRADRERIPMLDASAEFARHSGRTPLFLASSGVLSTEGHHLFAEILGQALLERAPHPSGPQALPVAGEAPAAPLTPTPLRTLERRPREPAPSTDGPQ